ncbi:NmrA family NAD(P)-binding protein [Nodosilinea sp. PGN35]|uniref:NmrA family NAD(P)-binding protein n=1 Tax=Nodosilinea sp. PGN35 TaxID=3020489 RepID=UPI0023B328A4|nr:NmrA family NAD(P)-binding protein [Nodosilinea sp. TSF1-S3]MDF0369651.1 NmrA family NAD(P)-binding protein [Nodosilinea sp. TSF1-S3]
MATVNHFPKILVTGATGKTGSAVVAQLCENGWPVRAMVRARDARSQRLESLGAETVVADMFDPNQVLDAMQGTRRAYYCPPLHPYMIQSAAAFVAAARQSKLEAIVGLSQWLASPNHPSLHTRQLWLVEQMLSDLPGVAHVTLNPGYFADNYLRLLDFAALLGVFPILTGHSRNAPPSNEDIARVAVALLMDPEGHAGRSYRPTGPQLISAYEMVPIIRKVLRSPVLAINLPLWMFLRTARLQGVSAFELSSFRYYLEDHKQGAFELGAPTDVVQTLTGQPPETFETTVRRYAALPFARRTFANRLRAFINFNRVPFTPGYNLDRFEREQFHPRPPVPQLAMGDLQWQASHSS